MYVKGIDDEDAVTYDANEVVAGVKKVYNNRIPFATDDMEVLDSFRFFEQRTKDTMHGVDVVADEHFSYIAYCVLLSRMLSVTSLFERLVTQIWHIHMNG